MSDTSNSSILKGYLAHFPASATQKFSLKKVFIFFPEKTVLKKFLIFSQKSPPLILRKRNLLRFRERYTQSPDIFSIRSIFRTMVYSKSEAYSEDCQTSMMESFVKNSCLAHFLTSTLNIFP